jgi:hypothetical protein
MKYCGNSEKEKLSRSSRYHITKILRARLLNSIAYIIYTKPSQVMYVMFSCGIKCSHYTAMHV